MTRVKRGRTRHARHTATLHGAEGIQKHTFKTAHEAVMRRETYQYRDRRTRKRDMRRLWILRINAAARQYGLSYSQLMHLLHQEDVQLDRKTLADLAVHHTEAFRDVVKGVGARVGKE